MSLSISTITPSWSSLLRNPIFGTCHDQSPPTPIIIAPLPLILNAAQHLLWHLPWSITPHPNHQWQNQKSSLPMAIQPSIGLSIAAPWARSIQNPYVSTGPLAHLSLARSHCSSVENWMMRWVFLLYFSFFWPIMHWSSLLFSYYALILQTLWYAISLVLFHIVIFWRNCYCSRNSALHACSHRYIKIIPFSFLSIHIVVFLAGLLLLLKFRLTCVLAFLCDDNSIHLSIEILIHYSASIHLSVANKGEIAENHYFSLQNAYLNHPWLINYLAILHGYRTFCLDLSIHLHLRRSVPQSCPQVLDPPWVYHAVGPISL